MLAAVARKKTDLRLEDISLSLISLFELQAKGAKLQVPAKSTIRAIDAMVSAFRIVPFYEAPVIEAAQRLRKVVSDYVDCIILATAIASEEDVVTEDSIVLEKKRKLLKDYDLRVLSFDDLTSV